MDNPLLIVMRRPGGEPRERLVVAKRWCEERGREWSFLLRPHGDAMCFGAVRVGRQMTDGDTAALDQDAHRRVAVRLQIIQHDDVTVAIVGRALLGPSKNFSA